MATIITGPNPAFAQAFRPQQENPLDQYARLMQLKQMQTMQPIQQQAAQQQLQAGQLDVQQKQQALKDQQAITSSMQNWDGKDYNDLYPLMLKNGASGTAVLGLKQKVLEQQQAISTTLKNNADAGLAQINATKAKGDELAGALAPLIDAKQTPDEQLPQAVQAAAQSLVQRGILDPQHAQTAAQLSSLPPDQIRAQLTLLKNSMLAQSQIADEAVKTAGVNKDVAQTGEANARTQQIQQQTQFGPIGPASEAKYRFILQKKAAGHALTPEEQSYAQAFEASNAKQTTQADSLGVTSTNTSRPAGLTAVGGGRSPAPPAAPGTEGGTIPLLPRSNAPSSSPLSPANVKMGIVDQIGQYRENPTLIGRLIAKHPEIMAAVQQKYPDWDQTTYNAKNKLISDYTSGKDSQSINAMNTAVGHLSALDDAATALHNNNVQALNKIANSLGAQVGADAKTTYDMIVHRVGPEIAGAYIPGGGGEGERQATAQDFSSSMSPQQIHNNVAGSINLFRSKVAALENQYKNTVGRDDFEQKFFTPEARAAFKKYGGQGGGAPNIGDVKTFPNGKKGKWDGTGWEQQ